MREIKFDIVFDSQRIFRILLDAFAHPGKICKIPVLAITPPPSISKTCAGILFTLLDFEVGFFVNAYDKKEEIEEYFIINTGAKLKDLESADFILSLGELPKLERVKRGSLEYPDQGATVIYVIEEIGENLGKGSLSLTLTGPGIDGERNLQLTGLKKREILEIIEVNKEFPLGVDFVFVDRKENFFTLLRSTKIIEVKEN